MKLPIDGIQAFVLIAELGSDQRAAEQLALTQTALTRRIQRLESFVGARFLEISPLTRDLVLPFYRNALQSRTA